MYKTSLDWASQNPNMDTVRVHEVIPTYKLLAMYSCTGTESQYSPEICCWHVLVNIPMPGHTRNTK